MGAVKSGLGEALDVDVERKRDVLPSAWRGKPFFKGFPDRRVSLAAQCEHQGRGTAANGIDHFLRHLRCIAPHDERWAANARRISPDAVFS
jgi:hypothetical protein